MYKQKLVVIIFAAYTTCIAAKENAVVASQTGERTYSHFVEPELPAEIEEVNKPIELEAVYVGRIACSDYSGAGVEKFLETGRHPKKYSTGKLTVRATKPTIKRQLRYIKGTPAHLTVTSFKDSCLGALVRGEKTRPPSRKVLKQAVEEQTESLNEELNRLRQRVKTLEERVNALES